ncbi:MAG: AraC family transcriptional regulator [Verrucomicrobiota bacterium JB024]|nr:AraC family transcriptional regulator [Verrucomicrobiota bacterium JB024]
MLAYFNSGKRRYFEKPVRGQVRLFWEFQAVVQGAIGQTFPDGIGDTEPRARTLWLSPPGSSHGWTGERGKVASIVVFHFRYIPEILAQAVGTGTGINIPLGRGDCQRLRRLGEQVRAYWEQPAPGMMLCYEYALMELSLLVYESLGRNAPRAGQRVRARVQDALGWFSEHMRENPGLEDVARAVHLSPAHLRRLFHESLQNAPKEVFDQIRFQRAMQLITDTDLPVGEISLACGYEEQSSFTRAFKRRFGTSPRALRSAGQPGKRPEISWLTMDG